VIQAAPISDHMSELHASEQRCVDSAVEKRKAEFSTGRVLSARALQLLEVRGQPILRGSKNEPLWPSGLVGSISHTSQTCVVVIAYDHICSGIGIDVEARDANISDLAHLILRPGELDKTYDNPGEIYDDAVRLTFSAKESIFKSVFAHVGRFVEFEEVGLEFDSTLQSFIATAPDDKKLHKLVQSGQGKYLMLADLIVTGFYLPGSGCVTRN